jgi:hypothetical protein
MCKREDSSLLLILSGHSTKALQVRAINNILIGLHLIVFSISTLVELFKNTCVHNLEQS